MCKKLRTNRKVLVIFLSVVVTVVVLLTYFPLQMGQQAMAAEVTLSNPRTDANGVSTWDCVYFGN